MLLVPRTDETTKLLELLNEREQAQGEGARWEEGGYHIAM